MEKVLDKYWNGINLLIIDFSINSFQLTFENLLTEQ